MTLAHFRNRVKSILSEEEFEKFSDFEYLSMISVKDKNVYCSEHKETPIKVIGIYNDGVFCYGYNVQPWYCSYSNINKLCKVSFNNVIDLLTK